MGYVCAVKLVLNKASVDNAISIPWTFWFSRLRNNIDFYVSHLFTCGGRDSEQTSHQMTVSRTERQWRISEAFEILLTLHRSWPYVIKVPSKASTSSQTATSQNNHNNICGFVCCIKNQLKCDSASMLIPLNRAHSQNSHIFVKNCRV